MLKTNLPRKCHAPSVAGRSSLWVWIWCLNHLPRLFQLLPPWILVFKADWVRKMATPVRLDNLFRSRDLEECQQHQKHTWLFDDTFETTILWLSMCVNLRMLHFFNEHVFRNSYYLRPIRLFGKNEYSSKDSTIDVGSLHQLNPSILHRRSMKLLKLTNRKRRWWTLERPVSFVDKKSICFLGVQRKT